MKKAIIALIVLTAVITAVIPTVSFTEDGATVRLAKVIYAVAGGESYEAKLALGALVMNRVESPWFPSNLYEVLSQQQQFPAGRKYDAESLRAAHEIIAGERTIAPLLLYYRAADASEKWEIAPDEQIGGLLFYTQNGNR